MAHRVLFLSIVLGFLTTTVRGVELVQLGPTTWDKFVPQGKEVDAIYGDYVLRNEQLTAVIAAPLATRNANMTVRNVGGCVIDLSTREGESDQLSAWYPGGEVDYRQLRVATVKEGVAEAVQQVPAEFRVEQTIRVTVSAEAVAKEKRPAITTHYELAPGSRALAITTVYTNPHAEPLEIELYDRVRADRSFEFGGDGALRLAWWYDAWFGQAYGVVPDRGLAERFVPPAPKQGKSKPPEVRYRHAGGKATTTLAPGASYTLSRSLIPGRNLVDVKAIATEHAFRATHSVAVTLTDSQGPVAGGPVAGGTVTVKQGGQRYAWGRSDAQGRLTLRLPAGKYEVVAVGFARGEQTANVEVPQQGALALEFPPPGYVAATITDEAGREIPCKVEFRYPTAGPTDDFTPPANAPKTSPPPRPKPPGPDFGPDSGDQAVRNLYYSPTGRFTQELPPGEYDVVISHGPEYDAVFTKLSIERGRKSPLVAKLVRTVHTPGWLSADFHSHSTPSGDNTASQTGRVLNLVCEHVEFAPCTEHNRIDSYTPILKRLGIERRLATCSGIELTWEPLPVNHQNAFPLVPKPRTQDGGGPPTDVNPLVQIERLALWDNASEKLMQMNHPDLVRILGDRDIDGKPDGGYAGMFGFVDVMEVHPPHQIFQGPPTLAQTHKEPVAIFHWMQMLNLGYRIPGGVHTDAHYNFHGSGFLRTYVKSPSDDPAEVKILDLVRAAERGQMVMTNGPFLDVRLHAATAGERSQGGPGDDVSAPGGKATLSVRVQCANWLDVDRVQVFINGRAEPKLNFTRREHGAKFRRGVVRFDEQIPLELASDAHVIVAVIGEQAKLGLVYGPEHGQAQPVAVANPIFVDTDGQGFRPNGDLLGLPIAHPETPPPRKKP